MDELLSIAEIHERFESEWVLLEELEPSSGPHVERGRVRCHSKDRDEIHRKANVLRPKRFAIVYTGSVPEGTAIVL